MMNWTRFFPTLLAAHRHRGAVCTAFSTTTTEPAAEPRAPALSPIVTSFVVAFLALAGKSAVDVLQDLPSLRIDAMDRTIQLRGNQSVAIHVNGEPVSLTGKALVQYLKGLSGEDVKRVEINTNPSARHDASVELDMSRGRHEALLTQLEAGLS